MLYSFGTFDSGDALEPIGGNGLTLAGSTLFGLTTNGGGSQNGAIFSINTDGSGYQVVHSFSANDGVGPFGALTLSGSQLYGTTSGIGIGASGGTGSLFSASVDGRAFTVLQIFGGGPADGQTGVGNPAISVDGTVVYGMTQNGGSNFNGTIFSSPASGSSTNANLFSLVPSVGTLDIAFDSETVRYTVVVSDAVTAMTVTPTTEDAGAALMVNGVAAAFRRAEFTYLSEHGIQCYQYLRDRAGWSDDQPLHAHCRPPDPLAKLAAESSRNLGQCRQRGGHVPTTISNVDRQPDGIRLRIGPDIARFPTNPATGFQRGKSGILALPSHRESSGIVYGAEWTQSLNPPTWTPLADTGSGSMHSFQAFAGNLPSAFMRLTVSVPLSPIEQLGKDIFFDTTLSNPPGLSCAGCHSPAAGFTGPNSAINLAAGPVPGAVAGRSGFRKPQAVGYSAFSPSGPFFDAAQGFWSGGNFWDGRAPTNASQALMPFIGPNEMANTPVGPYPPHAGGYSPAVVQKISQGSYAALFQQVFGAGVFQAGKEAAAYAKATQAIAAYEASAEVVPFSSKYDASVNAVAGLECLHFHRGRGKRAAAFLRKSSVCGVPFVGLVGFRLECDQWPGGLHHVLLRQYRCAAQPEQSLLSADGSDE